MNFMPVNLLLAAVPSTAQFLRTASVSAAVTPCEPVFLLQRFQVSESIAAGIMVPLAFQELVF